MPETIRRRLRITGRVQGVWFRGSTEREGQRLGVRGWVRNVPDGSVEVLVEGESDSVQALVAWCHHGPSGARVDRVVETPEPAQGDLQPFTTTY